MFGQLLIEKTQNIKSTLKNRRKRQNKSKKQKSIRKNLKKKNLKLATSMSSWAENFTMAATWQLKHQIAYWKAKTKALEYENQVLHDIIRRNRYTHTESEECSNIESEVVEATDHFDTNEECYDEEFHDEEDYDEENIIESEELVQFLRANEKYREDARRERERLRGKNEDNEQLHINPPEDIEESRAKLKELYGDKWLRVSALEIATLSQFINNVDKDKAMHWPNIPFNFNFGS